jgi:hypothetical protein
MIAGFAGQLAMNITDWRSKVDNTTHHAISTSDPSRGLVSAICNVLFVTVANINYRYDREVKY